jgi:hypothetical protein
LLKVHIPNVIVQISVSQFGSSLDHFPRGFPSLLIRPELPIELLSLLPELRGQLLRDLSGFQPFKKILILSHPPSFRPNFHPPANCQSNGLNPPSNR